ncbi:MAG: hypothetical protein M1818_002598 [Claussenomyces sp. TS43310]|nr:MAG: hypothetical protein M1818_002598 [Claussenomyces sp. TS43310]
MTSIVAKYISKRVLGETARNNFGTEDPYFEQVPATRLDGRPSSKTKKRRKALPAGVSEHDGKVLTKVKRRAYRLDMSLWNCCGIRFGWGSVIGIIPAIGDVIDALMAVMVMRTAEQIEGGLPTGVKSKMMLNIVLDFGIGLVPFLGDIADAVFRANTRNAVLLEKHLRAKGAKALKAQGEAVPTIDPSHPDEYDRLMREEHGPPPQYTTTGPETTQVNAQRSRLPQAIPVKETRRGWFVGFGGKRNKQQDVEQGDIISQHRDEALPASTLQKSRPAN